MWSEVKKVPIEIAIYIYKKNFLLCAKSKDFEIEKRSYENINSSIPWIRLLQILTLFVFFKHNLFHYKY